jgi:2-oxoglutarate dehydrogenase E2 component (dihydrolipoamide succinyltransferase)
MADITMPQLGETVTEGTITRWAKQVGDEVKEDEVLFEVSTDKVDSEVPSPASGYLAEILVPEGETVDVGVKLAVITDAPPGAGAAPAPPAAQPEPEPATAAAEAEQAGATEEDATAEAAPDLRQLGPGARPSGAAEPAPAPSGNGGEGRVLSPVVRRLLAEHNLDAAQITGTGAGGRITRADVLAVIDAQGGAAAVGARRLSHRERGPAGSAGRAESGAGAAGAR